MCHLHFALFWNKHCAIFGLKQCWDLRATSLGKTAQISFWVFPGWIRTHGQPEWASDLMHPLKQLFFTYLFNIHLMGLLEKIFSINTTRELQQHTMLLDRHIFVPGRAGNIPAKWFSDLYHPSLKNFLRKRGREKDKRIITTTCFRF